MGKDTQAGKLSENKDKDRYIRYVFLSGTRRRDQREPGEGRNTER